MPRPCPARCRRRRAPPPPPRPKSCTESVSPVPYRAPWWLRNRHLNTVYAAFLGKSVALPRMRRERWEMPDGDFIDVDWLAGESAPGTPLVVLFHGLEGSTRSHYVKMLAR